MFCSELLASSQDLNSATCTKVVVNKYFSMNANWSYIKGTCHKKRQHIPKLEYLAAETEGNSVCLKDGVSKVEFLTWP